MKIILYYAPIACSIAPFITLHEAQAKFSIENINIWEKEQLAPDFLKINPKHKVPAIVYDGRALTENVAIQTWIAQTFPDSRILPDEPWQRLEATSILSWCSGGIHPFLTRINNPKKVCDSANSADSIKRLAAEALFENYGLANSMLTDREFFFDHFTAADAHFFWTFRRGKLFKMDLSQFTHCEAHFDRMLTRSSVQRALAYEKTVLEEYGMTL